MRFKPVKVSRQTLSGVRIFRDLQADECTAVAQSCRGGLFAANESVVSVKDDTHDVYFIASGKVRVTIISVSGKEVTFRDMGPGSVFGDLSAIDGKTRSASVITLEDSLIAWMPAEAFWAALERYPGVSRAMLKVLADLVRRLSDRVIEFSTLGVRNRLHAELLRLARDSMSGRNKAVISPTPTHHEIANRISTHREAVTRELQVLAKSDLLERRNRTWIINDVARLEQMVNQVKGE